VANDLLARLWDAFPSRRGTGAPSRVQRALAAAHSLLPEGGEVEGRRLASDLKAAYESLDTNDRVLFFHGLVNEFGPDARRLHDAIEAYRAGASAATLLDLQAAVEPPRQELFRRFNRAPGGTATLVGMRRDVLRGLEGHPDWRVLESDLLHLLRSWFNLGFLELRRIDWHTSAFTLERIIEYEAVHAVQGWTDLRRRLAADRRCYAYFHHALPHEPIIFIEVALTHELSGAVQPLLDPASPIGVPDRATHAIFYSITNCQEGLRGVSFGNFLIKQVVEDLRRELPRLHTFATLSPVPGFGRWLTETGQRPNAAAEGVPDELRAALMHLCARYLLQEKRNGVPIDPVARFHLTNGAQVERLHWKADTSPAGLRLSSGIMVNYVYRLDDVERNHEAYATIGRVAASARIQRLANQPPANGRLHDAPP
jgi:malonyl-CoA decarboxylase